MNKPTTLCPTHGKFPTQCGCSDEQIRRVLQESLPDNQNPSSSSSATLSVTEGEKAIARRTADSIIEWIAGPDPWQEWERQDMADAIYRAIQESKALSVTEAHPKEEGEPQRDQHCSCRANCIVHGDMQEKEPQHMEKMRAALYRIGKAAMESRATGEPLNPVFIGDVIDPLLYPERKPYRAGSEPERTGAPRLGHSVSEASSSEPVNSVLQKALEAVIADLADPYKWNWTRQGWDERSAADKALGLLEQHGLVIYRSHPMGGHIWEINGHLYGRTDDVEPTGAPLPVLSSQPNEEQGAPPVTQTPSMEGANKQ